MHASKLNLYSKSGVQTDWRCPRSFYWNYLHLDSGIVPLNTSLELGLGSVVHDALAAIARGLDIDRIAEQARADMLTLLLDGVDGDFDAMTFAQEQATLAEGLIRGFHRHVWPQLMAQYPKIVYIEKEMVYPHDGLHFLAKPDIVLSDSDDGDLVYVEYKTTSSKKESWINSWQTAVQLHSTCRAIQSYDHSRGNPPTEVGGRAIAGVIVQGLYKGYESYGKQSSPFCYAYKRTGNPPFTTDETSYEYRAGFKRYPTWELPGGVKAWVEGMPENVLSDQFPQTPLIMINDDLIDRFFKQQAYRHHEMRLAKEIIDANPDALMDILDVSFPQKFEACTPSFGRPCAYKRLCFGPEIEGIPPGFEAKPDKHLDAFKELIHEQEL
jgi:hypothetical protein